MKLKNIKCDKKTRIYIVMYIFLFLN